MRPPDVIPDARTDTTTPADFDPARYRILAAHWPGLPPPPPWQHISSPLARIIGRLRIVDDDEDQAA